MRAVHVEKNRYLDSVLLMSISREVKALPGVGDAVVCMATPANLKSLQDIGFEALEFAETSPNDLVIAIEAEDRRTLEEVHAQTAELLETRRRPLDQSDQLRPETVSQAVAILPEANLLIVSVPGAFAAREARAGLRHGLHVMLFSDNVSLDDEVALKQEARRRGLLMMGPDCGTAMINGKPLGFANAVRRGTIGIVGASGTGIQEINCLIHRGGGGISQTIGTGGRDLSSAVGGLMTQFAVATLCEDPRTEVIVVVSKFPSQDVADRLLDALEEVDKPCVVCFVGSQPQTERGRIRFAGTLHEAAVLACNEAGLEAEAIQPASNEEIAALATAEAEGRKVEQVVLRGLFCGGTLCQEAWALLDRQGLEVFSNVALRPERRIKPCQESEASGHLMWDLGDDAFTVGRPHPMIEPSLRDEHVIAAAQVPTVGVVLVDLVLGHGAHPDPAVGLAETVKKAKRIASQCGGILPVVTSVTGTDLDPQGYGRQVELLQQAGVRVARSNEDAARLALRIVRTMTGEA